MIVLINFGDGRFKRAQNLNSRSAYKNGEVDKVISYGTQDIDEIFYSKYAEILKQKRGAGYWLWKPYFINKALENMSEGDYLVYSDSGIYFTDSVKKLINSMNKAQTDIMLFSTGKHIESNWTKRDIFISLDCDNEKYTQSRQIWAGFIVFKCTGTSKAFVGEWLQWCCDKHLLTDEPSINNNYDGYIETRHDQSILSLLSKKHGILDFRDPSQHGVFREKLFAYDTLSRSHYPTIIDAHRQGTSGSIIEVKLIRVRRWLHSCMVSKRLINYADQFK